MSNWKVSKEKIQLFPHSNADKLQIGKVGSYQVVVKKGQFKDGDTIVFAPEKSLLSGELKKEYENYLVGPENNRVKSIRLRGEVSSGIIIPDNIIPNDVSKYKIGEDISEVLNISKYEPPIPQQLRGEVEGFSLPYIGHHDCEQYAVYANDFTPNERVVITEKLHGSQCIIAYNFDNDEMLISSKGMLKKLLKIKESEENTYWIAAKNIDIFNKIKKHFNSGTIQIFGEVIPVQKGFLYGHFNKNHPIVKVFDIRMNGQSIPYDKVANDFKDLWVPVLYDGPLEMDKNDDGDKTTFSFSKNIINYCKGMETVSGKQCHIKEGVVLRPYKDRYAKDGTKLRVKIINPKYKETGDEFN